jgi:copper chaperone
MQVFHVPEMHCGECVATVTRALQEADRNLSVQVDLATRTVRTASTRLYASFLRAIERAGFRAEPVIAPLG